jgi:hypothetical protein
MTEIDSVTTGKMSTFGGPADDGVEPDEGLALIEPGDLENPWFGRHFLRSQPEGTTGLARRLDPYGFYIAMRWDKSRFTREFLRYATVKVTNPANGKHVFVSPVDFGPGDGSVIDGQPTQDTGRIADLSPGAATALGLQTDDAVTCELVG